MERSFPFGVPLIHVSVCRAIFPSPDLAVTVTAASGAGQASVYPLTLPVAVYVPAAAVLTLDKSHVTATDWTRPVIAPPASQANQPASPSAVP